MGEMQGGTATALAYLAMAAVVICNIVGNIFMKIGSSAVGSRAVLLGLFGWQTAAGLLCFGLGVLFYALALKTLPLHVAQAVAALQFVGVVTAAVLVFGEAMSLEKWLGIALICSGLLLVTR